MYPRIIPEVYELETNDGKFLVNSHPTTVQMALYLNGKVNAGVAIEDLIFRIRPVKIPTCNDVLKKYF